MADYFAHACRFLARITITTVTICAATACGTVANPGSLHQPAAPATPILFWNAPSPITYGTALGAQQLNASANVPGTLIYTPSAGSILQPGKQLLSVHFQPSSARYSASTLSANITVLAPTTLSLNPHDQSIFVGETATLLPEITYSDGTQRLTGDGVLWNSNQPTILAVSSEGVASCVGVGVARIEAQITDVNGAAMVACTPTIRQISQQPFSTLPDEFVGPFPNWVNVKTTFGAIGDGVADDTAALQSALNSVGYHHGQPETVWIPAGTYRITNTLSLTAKQLGVVVVGEDPTTTKLVWDGPSTGAMFATHSALCAAIARITLDGSDRADTGLDLNNDPGATFSYNNRVYDSSFTRMKYGIRIGFAGETFIDRVRFTAISEAGVSTENYNALDVFVRDSYFEHCTRGLTNKIVQGHFHVYSSVFLGSSIADMEVDGPNYFSERGNISVGSHAFFVHIASRLEAAEITLEDNLIVDSTSSPVVMDDGQLMLIDNTILLPVSANYPIVATISSNPPDLFVIGNTLSHIPLSLAQTPRSISFENNVVPRGRFNIVPPSPAPFLPNRHRPRLDLPIGSGARQIQQALDWASTLAGERPVVHLPYGAYGIDKTLVIPAGSDVQVVGDGYVYGTILYSQGVGNAPVFHLEDPARATFRQIVIDEGSAPATGFQIDVKDIPGSRVVTSGTTVRPGTGIRLNGLDHVIVEARSTDVTAIHHAFDVIGGDVSVSGAYTFGRFSLFGGDSQSTAIDGTEFDVRSRGNITLQEDWHDGAAPSPLYANLNGSGTVTIQGSEIGTPGTPGTDPFRINGFNGSISILSFALENSPIHIFGDTSQTRSLVLGGLEIDHNYRGPLVSGPANSGNVAALNRHWYVDPPCPCSWNLEPDRASIDPAFIKEMLSRIRGIRPAPLELSDSELTDVRFDGVSVGGTGSDSVGIQVNPIDLPAAQSFLIEAAAGRGVLDDIAEIARIDAAGSQGTSWTFKSLDDGTVLLVDATTGLVLDSDLSVRAASGDLSQKWFVRFLGGGTFSICGEWSGLCLLPGESGELVSAPPGGFGGWKISPTPNS